MTMKRWHSLKEIAKKTAKILILILILLLPFISITSIMGIDTFIDSFENPDKYIYIKNHGSIINLDKTKEKYLIIQRANYPNFEIYKNDLIIYCKNDGNIACNQVFQIKGIGNFQRYQIKINENKEKNNTIYEYQIIGKIICQLEDNLWNSIAIKLWEISIKNLNINN